MKQRPHLQKPSSPLLIICLNHKFLWQMTAFLCENHSDQTGQTQYRFYAAGTIHRLYGPIYYMGKTELGRMYDNQSSMTLPLDYMKKKRKISKSKMEKWLKAKQALNLRRSCQKKRTSSMNGDMLIEIIVIQNITLSL